MVFSIKKKIVIFCVVERSRTSGLALRTGLLYPTELRRRMLYLSTSKGKMKEFAECSELVSRCVRDAETLGSIPSIPTERHALAGILGSIPSSPDKLRV